MSLGGESVMWLVAHRVVVCNYRSIGTGVGDGWGCKLSVLRAARASYCFR